MKSEEIIKKMAFLREEKKISRREIARIMGKDHSNVRKWEIGKTNIKLSTVEEYLNILDYELTITKKE